MQEYHEAQTAQPETPPATTGAFESALGGSLTASQSRASPTAHGQKTATPTANRAGLETATPLTFAPRWSHQAELSDNANRLAMELRRRTLVRGPRASWAIVRTSAGQERIDRAGKSRTRKARGFDITRALGWSPRTFHRALAELRGAGFIERQGQAVRLLAAAHLAAQDGALKEPNGALKPLPSRALEFLVPLPTEKNVTEREGGRFGKGVANLEEKEPALSRPPDRGSRESGSRKPEVLSPGDPGSVTDMLEELAKSHGVPVPKEERQQRFWEVRDALKEGATPEGLAENLRRCLEDDFARRNDYWGDVVKHSAKHPKKYPCKSRPREPQSAETFREIRQRRADWDPVEQEAAVGERRGSSLPVEEPPPIEMEAGEYKVAVIEREEPAEAVGAVDQDGTGESRLTPAERKALYKEQSQRALENLSAMGRRVS